jgi:hypothetical protein
MFPQRNSHKFTWIFLDGKTHDEMHQIVIYGSVLGNGLLKLILAATVPEDLVTNFFCRFSITRELHSDHGHNFVCRLLQEVLQRLGVSKTCTTPLHPQPDGLSERYVKTVKERLTKCSRVTPEGLG